MDQIAVTVENNTLCIVYVSYTGLRWVYSVSKYKDSALHKVFCDQISRSIKPKQPEGEV